MSYFHMFIIMSGSYYSVSFSLTAHAVLHDLFATGDP